MIYTNLTKAAMNIATDAHHGQLDHGGYPYIHHPLHLAEQMPDEYTVCAALLHDVVEDTSVTLEDLASVFPSEVVAAVALLTHSEDTDYFEYIAAIHQNPIARAVKIADLNHNSDPSRLEITEKNRDFILRHAEKYRKALEMLK